MRNATYNLLITFIFLFSATAIAQTDISEWEPVASNDYSLNENGGFTNRRTRVITDRWLITNETDQEIVGPFLLEIVITPANVTSVLNRDDLSLTNTAVFNFTNSTLAPGESLNVELQFANPGRTRFTYTQNLYTPLSITGEPPLIISQPNKKAVADQTYVYDVETQSNPSLPTFTLEQAPASAQINVENGVVNWLPNIEYAQGLSSVNEYCLVSNGDITRAQQNFADFTVIMDYSGSMNGEWEWVEAFIPSLEAGLLAEDIGTDVPNYYGLMETSFRDTGEQLFMDGQLLNTYDRFVNLASDFRGSGSEAGWSGISYVLQNYPLRENSARNFILVTDEPEQSRGNLGLTFDSVLDALQQENVTLNAVLEIEIMCQSTQEPAIGMNSDGVGYVADGEGGFTFCSDPVLLPSAGNTEEAYVDLAFATNGAVWSISQLRVGGANAVSFSRALQEIKIQEIREQLGDTPLADLSVNNLSFDSQQLSFSIANRGLVDSVAASIAIDISEDGISWQTIETLQLSALSPQLQSDFSLDINLISLNANYIRVSILPENQNTECLVGNNNAVLTKFEVSAQNDFGNDEQTFWVSTVSEDAPPVFISSPILTSSQNSQYLYNAQISDSKGDAHIFSLISAPDGMSIDPYNGIIVWRPAINQIGTQNIIIQVEDLAGNQATQSFELEIVTDGAQGEGPVFESGIVNQPFIRNSQLSYIPALQDNPELEYNFELLTPTPECSLVDANTGEVFCEFGANIPLLRSLFIKAEDQFGRYAVQLLSINTSPIFTSDPLDRVASGRLYSYTVSASDADRDAITYSFVSGPDGMFMDGRRLRWEIALGQEGVYPVQISVSDTKAGFSVQSFDLTVTANSSPVFTSVPITEAVQGSLYNYRMVAIDDDRDRITYALISGPEGMVANGANLQWTPSTAQIGRFEVVISATDPFGLSEEQSFEILTGDNVPPSIISTPSLQGITGHPYTYDIQVSDTDDSRFTYELVVAPTGMRVSRNDLLWTPSPEQTGNIPITLRVKDEFGNSALQEFVVLVVPNQAPVFTTSPIAEATTLHSYSYSSRATDADDSDGRISYTLSEAPVGMSNSGRRIFWTPTSAQIGSFPVTIVATDRHGGVTEQRFILVVSANQAPAFTSTANPLAIVANEYIYAATARDSDGDRLTYELVQAPSGALLGGRLNNVITWTPTSDQVGQQLIRIRAIDQYGASNEQAFTVDVRGGLAFTANYGDLEIEATRRFSRRVTATAPGNPAVQYQLIDPPTGVTINSNLVTWSPRADQLGQHLITVEATTVNESVRTSWVYTVIERNDAPIIRSTAVTTAKAGDAYTYAVEVTDANSDLLNYELLTAPAGMNINPSTGEITWTPNPQQTFRYAVNWRVLDPSGASDSQFYRVTVAPRDNTAPRFVSVAPTQATLLELYSYLPVVEDDENDAFSFRLVTAPSGMTIDTNSGQIFWTAARSQLGSNSVVIEVNDGLEGISTQAFVIELSDTENSAPQFNSTPSTAAIAGQEYQYTVLASDVDEDDIAVSLITSPLGMRLDTTTNLLTWTPTLEQVGSNSVVISISDGREETLQSFIVETAEPVFAVNVSASKTVLNFGDVALISVEASEAMGPVTLALTANGIPLSLNANNQAEFSSDTEGEVTLVANASDNTGSVTNSLVLVVRDPANVEPIVVDLADELDNALIAAPTQINATIGGTDLSDWTLTYAKSGSDENVFLAQGSDALSDEAIATLDPTLLENGQYKLSLSATDVNGITSVAESAIAIDGNLKFGEFSFFVEDLNVPLAGLPISIRREYDSRRRNQSLDFGYGWSVDYQQVTIEESRPLGQDWEIVVFPGFLPTYCIEPIGASPLITIKLPNGDVERFEVDDARGCSVLPQFLNVSFNFRPVGDNQSSLIALGDATGNLELGGTNIINSSTGGVVNPTQYRLTTKEGLVYVLNKSFGILSVTDQNGNSLTYTDNGIFHSSGKSIAFERDAQDRITKVIDPAGNAINYAYDGNGDLSSVTERDGAVNRYTYYGNFCAVGAAISENCHLLNEAIDPLGRSYVRNIYDDEGRLIAQEDQNGNRSDFSYDIEARQTVQVDRNGFATILTYDERGNIVSRTDALGNTRTYTYDESDNQISATDENGNTTLSTYNARKDRLSLTTALGNITTAQYNDFGFVTLLTNPLGDATTLTYDSTGSLLSVSDAQGNLSSSVLNAQGLVETKTDALGNTTLYEYDAQGNIIKETDALGSETSYTYDDNNNMLSMSVTRSIQSVSGPSIEVEVTRYEYDDRNRQIRKVDALGGVSTIEYDLLGNVSATVNELGQRTSSIYDVYNNLIETIYPDGTSDTYSYDPENNRISSTDRLGRTTRFTYDALNRQTGVIYPDGGSVIIEYDPAGNVIAETDEEGNRVSYEYDADNRRVAIIDALGNRTEIGFDAAGNKVSEVDANLNETKYEYDANLTLTKTIFADATEQVQEYDALIRHIGTTDQAGNETTYTYDALGRLTSVQDALGNTTLYSYDERGNKLTETDAQGRTTSWTYDALGRVLTRELPLGQVESYAYDALGNKTRHTDFNGQVHLYFYDINNRMVRSEFADGSVEQLTYDAEGNRLSSSLTQDGNVLEWAYEYDERNRLIREEKPDGSAIEYAYDLVGNKTELSIVNNANVSTETYVYDENNRLIELTDANSEITTYSFDAVSNRKSQLNHNGNLTTYNYDVLNRLISMDTVDKNDDTVLSFEYELDAVGNRILTSELDGRELIHTYDALYRVLTELITSSSNITEREASFTYDAVGNRLSSNINGVVSSFEYDDNNRLLSEDSKIFTYDNIGNTLTESDAGQLTSYQYDSQNQMIISTKGLEITSYQYDVDGIRYSKEQNGQRVLFLVDHNRDYAQVLQESSGQEIVSYVYGLDLISMTNSDGVFSYHYDGLGSTRMLSNSLGLVSDTYSYAAFGELLLQTGETANTYLYAGEQFDSALNQYYLRARYYNQAIGRFTQMDSWMGKVKKPITLNKYIYADANPINMIDPSGYASSTIEMMILERSEENLQIVGDIYESVIAAVSGDLSVFEDAIMSRLDRNIDMAIDLLPDSVGKDLIKKIREITGNS